MPSTGKRHGEKARFRARMEELGEQQVRLLMSTGGLPMQLQPQILESLTEPLWSSLAIQVVPLFDLEKIRSLDLIVLALYPTSASTGLALKPCSPIRRQCTRLTASRPATRAEIILKKSGG